MNFVAGTVCLLPQNKFSEALRLYNTYIWTSLGSLIALTEVCWLSETQRAIPTLLLHLLWEYGEGGWIGGLEGIMSWILALLGCIHHPPSHCCYLLLVKQCC